MYEHIYCTCPFVVYWIFYYVILCSLIYKIKIIYFTSNNTYLIQYICKFLSI